MITMFRIGSWGNYQHYKDRNPPWIKLHYELLTSRVWCALDDASRVLAIASMMLASRNHDNWGCVPNDPDYIRRAAYLNGPPDFEPLVRCGFLEPVDDAPPHTPRPEDAETENRDRDRAASVPLAVASVPLAVAVKPIKAPFKAKRGTEYAQDFEAAWKAYPDKSGKTKAMESYAKHRASGDTQEAIMAGIGRYIAYVTVKRASGHDLQWRNGQTFFNQACWRDEWAVASLPPVGTQGPRKQNPGGQGAILTLAKPEEY